MTRPLREREMLRVSVDDDGDEISIEEQHEDNVADALAIGNVPPILEDAYREVGSASEFAKRKRVKFDELLDDIENNRFGAEVLRMWEDSRVWRQTLDAAVLLKLLQKRGILVRITTHKRTYDPRNWHDREFLLSSAIKSEGESHKTSMRLRRDAAKRAAMGSPNGRPSYGFRRRFDPVTGARLPRERDPVEFPILDEIFRRLERGDTETSIARDLNGRGIKTRMGARWDASKIGRLARRHAYRGVREHHPGRKGTTGMTATPKLSPGRWDAIVKEERWLRVNNMLNDPARMQGHFTAVKHVFTGCPVCDVCGHVHRVHHRKGREYWRCSGPESNCTSLPKQGLDDVLDAVVIAYLAREEIYQGLQVDQTAELEDLRRQMAEAQRQLSELRQAVGARRLDVGALIIAEPPLLAEIEGLERKAKAITTPEAIRIFTEDGEDYDPNVSREENMTRRWFAGSISARHAVAKILLTEPYIGQPRIIRAPRRGPGVPVSERLVWKRPDGIVKF